MDVCLRVKKGTGGDGAVKPEPYDGSGACGWVWFGEGSVLCVWNACMRAMPRDVYAHPPNPNTYTNPRDRLANRKKKEPEFDVKVLSVVLPCLAELSAVRIHMNQVQHPRLHTTPGAP